MPDPGPNDAKLQLQEADPIPLTVARGPAPPALVVPGGWRIEGLPGTVREAGPSAERRLLEFFTAEISNPNTRLVASSSAPRSSSNTTVILRRADHRPFPPRTAAAAATVALRAPFAPPAAPFLPLDIA